MEKSTFRIEGDKYVPYEPTVIEDWERFLEDDLEKNPHVLAYPSRLLLIGRQTSTDLNRKIDLLAIDADRRIVVIELKKNSTPREMIAQALEYTAFIRRQDYEALNTIAMDYFAKRRARLPDHQQPMWSSLAEAHTSFFEDLVAPDSEGAFAINPSEVIVLEGQEITKDIVDVARYLRAKDIDIRVLQFGYQEDADGKRLLTVDPLVGTEKTPTTIKEAAAPKSSPAERLVKFSLAPLFEKLVETIQESGLSRRDTRMNVAFDLPLNGSHVASVWPSSSQPLVFFVIFGRNVNQELQDRYQEFVESIDVPLNRGKGNLSIHIGAASAGKIAELAEGFRRLVIAELER